MFQFPLNLSRRSPNRGFVAMLAIVIAALFTLPTHECRADKPIPAFSLPDTQGRTISSVSVDADLIVVAFLGVECPLAQLYAGTLSEMAHQLAGEPVQFLAIDSNQQDSRADLQQFLKDNPLGFPLLQDHGNHVADLFDAERTPEVFLLDKARHVRYRGRIDDQFGIGYRRQQPTRRDLWLAIEAIRNNQPVEIPRTAAVGCKIGRLRKPDPAATVTWSGQIAAIFQDRCQQCHRDGQIGPFALTSYEDARAWGEMIAEVVANERMPPWGASQKGEAFQNDPSLNADEKNLIQQWVQSGCPEGDLNAAPTPRDFTPGWQLDRAPDLVLPMSDTPFTVPADGTVEYQYFIADPQLTEGKWAVAAECRPGNLRVVHHVSIFLLLPDMAEKTAHLSDLWELQKNLLCTYVPGMRPVRFPEGTAYYLPPGTKIVFQVHFTPVGTVEQDCCTLGILFTDAASVKRRLTTLPLINNTFEIPPHAPLTEVETWHTFPAETLIHGFFPHMHLRGRSFQYIAHFPDGRSKLLCDIPRYQFDWQTRYLMKQPVVMPPGSRIQCVATYDNSPENPNNPDPSATVYWGDQSFEEMMIGYLDVSLPEQQSLEKSQPTGKLAIPWLTLALATVLVVLGGVLSMQRSTIRGPHAT